MKISEIARRTGYSNSHIRRLAKKGVIPGSRTTKGGHYFCLTTTRLRKWIGLQTGRKARRRLKAQLREARRERRAYPREQNSGKVYTLASLGLEWAHWRNTVLLKQLETATPEILRYWLKDLQEPHLAYIAVAKRLIDLTRNRR